MNFIGVEMSPFLGWLLKTTLHGSVLIGLIIATRWSLRARLAARWQHALWLLLLLRLASPWMPQSRLSLSNLIFKSVPRSHFTAITGKHVSANELPNTSEPTTKSEQESGIGLAEKQSPSVATTNAEPAAVPRQPAASEVPSDIGQVQDLSISTVLTRLSAIWPGLWLTGALGLGVYIGLRNLRLWLLVTAERQLVDQEVLELLEDCKLQMRVKTPVSVVITDKLRSPALFGFVRPRILLPQGLLEMVSLDELQYVFLHELAHLKRGDIYLRWLTAILQILHWFNPLIWFGFRQMHADQESACDALAMSRMASEETPLYGRTLVRLLERFSQPQYLPSVAGILEDRSRLERRMIMISQFTNSSYRWSPMAAVLIVGLACIVLPDAPQMTKGSETLAETSSSKSNENAKIAGSKAVSGLTLRKLSDNPPGFQLINGRSVSRDGRYLLGYAGILDLTTGKIRKLEGFEKSQFTPDGTRIVGSRRWPGPERAIVVHDLQSGKTEEIYRNDDIEDIGMYMDCSSVGQNILASFRKKDKSMELVSISIGDGAVRVLKALADGTYNDYRFSPDGRWVAYGTRSTARPYSNDQRDIYLLAVDGSSEIPLIQHPANDQLLGWAPFDDRILFASNRRGTWDAYMIQVVDGKPVGEAMLVKAAISDWPQMYADARTGLGFTDSGAFYYLPETDTTDVYIAALDPTTGKAQGKPIKATKIENTMRDTPAWSPDSRFLVCDALRGKNPGVKSLRIRDMETGKIRELATDAGGVTYPKWSPDGQSILAMGWGDSGRQAVRIDPESGKSTVVVASDGTSWWQNWPGWNWSADGRSFYRQSGTETLVRHDLDTGDKTEIPIPKNYSHAVLSPDCEHFVYSKKAIDANTLSRTINIRPTNGGTVRQLVKLSGAEAIRSWADMGNDKGLSWTPDSRYVLFVKGKSGNSKVHSLWRVLAAGGEPEALGLEMKGLRQPAISPDGRHIAFTTGGSKVELWSMENFLPNDDAAAK